MSEIKLHETVNAAIWAKEFCKRWPSALCAIPGKEGVQGGEEFEATMIGWFANAIMTGVDSVIAERDALKAGRVKVKLLVWDVDGRSLHMDHTMAFSKSYNWDGWDCFRQEGYGIGASYIIWPDSICIEKWNLYGTADGLFVNDLRGEGAAKAAAQADYEARILSALELTPDTSQIDAIRAALEAAAEVCAGIRQRISNGPMPEGARFDYEQAIRDLDPATIAAKLKGDWNERA